MPCNQFESRRQPVGCDRMNTSDDDERCILTFTRFDIVRCLIFVVVIVVLEEVVFENV
jgi:hypothetical protein